MPRYTQVVLLVDEEGRALGSDGILNVAEATINSRTPVNANASGANQQVIAAQGASARIVVRKLSLHNAAAVAQLVTIRDGSGGYVAWKGVLAASGGGSLVDFGKGWYLTPNSGLFLSATSSNVDINVTDWGVE